MQLVEQHCIGKSDPGFASIDRVAFASKNLYNAALYEMRQAYIFRGERLCYEEVYHRMKTHEAYKALPAKVAQQVLKQLDKAWKGYFAACEAYRADPCKFLGHPRLPKHKDKQYGRNLLVYTIQAISKPALKRGEIAPSGLPITVKTKHRNVDQVRIIPKSTHYVVEVIYEQEAEPASVDVSLIAGIDVGLDTLAALTSTKAGFRPVLWNGKPLKAINQWYNKRRAHLQGQLKGKRFSSRQLERLTDKRNLCIHHLLHVISRRIIDLLVQEGIGTLVIGKNPNWKQEINLGKRTNQNFVSIPHARFIEMLSYKAKLVGIKVIVTEESYTSKCSFLDREPIEKHEQYVGKRVHRGLFRASDGRTLPADVNGSLNMVRKVIPDAFTGRGIGDVVVHPVRISVQS
jgi:putative transposase